jgi:hypothetical protein
VTKDDVSEPLRVEYLRDRAANSLVRLVEARANERRPLVVDQKLVEADRVLARGQTADAVDAIDDLVDLRHLRTSHSSTYVYQEGIASMTLTADVVGTIRETRYPAFPSSVSYSSAERSTPPGTVNITRSRILPGCGTSPAGSCRGS